MDGRILALCGAGDRDGAANLMDAFETEIYASPNGMLMRQCEPLMHAAIEAHLEATAPNRRIIDHVCDIPDDERLGSMHLDTN